jgi:hypothetical protein
MSGIGRTVAMAMLAALALGPTGAPPAARAQPPAAPPPGAGAPAGAARTILARAPVEVIARGQTAAAPLATGARLAPGDRVRTGRGGAAELVLGDGSLLRVGELSEVTVDTLDVDPAGAPVASRFTLAAGQARAWVARQLFARVAAAPGRFAVQTPTAVAAVRQTDFAVLQGLAPAPGRRPVPAGPDQARVLVFSGAVQTDARGAGQVVCTRNRYTEVVPGRDPSPCRVIPLKDRRSVLQALAFEAAAVDPGHPDRAAAAGIGAGLDRTTGGRLSGPGVPAQTGRFDPAREEGTVSVDVVIE